MRGPATIAASQPDAIERAAAALGRGEMIAVPTDTVYGLAAIATSRSGTDAIFAAKARPETVALPVLVADLDQARPLVADDAALCAIGAALWPGALTLVTRRAPGLRVRLGGDESTIGLRCPAAPFVRALARRCGPLAVTSANRHHDEPCQRSDEVRAIFGDALLIVDGGVLDQPVSSVVSLLGPEPAVLRAGAVDLEAVRSALAHPAGPAR